MHKTLSLINSSTAAGKRSFMGAARASWRTVVRNTALRKDEKHKHPTEPPAFKPTDELCSSKLDQRLRRFFPTGFDSSPQQPSYFLMVFIGLMLAVSYTAGTAGVTILVFQYKNSISPTPGPVEALVLGYLFALLSIECLWLLMQRQTTHWKVYAESLDLEREKWNLLLREKAQEVRHLAIRLTNISEQEQEASARAELLAKISGEKIAGRFPGNMSSTRHQRMHHICNASHNPLRRASSDNSLCTKTRASDSVIPSRNQRSADTLITRRSMTIDQNQAVVSDLDIDAAQRSLIRRSGIKAAIGNRHRARFPFQSMVSEASNELQHEQESDRGSARLMTLRSGPLSRVRLEKHRDSVPVWSYTTRDRDYSGFQQPLMEFRSFSSPNLDHFLCVKKDETGLKEKVLEFTQQDHIGNSHQYDSKPAILDLVGNSCTSQVSNWTHKLDLNESRPSPSPSPQLSNELPIPRTSLLPRASSAVPVDVNRISEGHQSCAHNSTGFPPRTDSLRATHPGHEVINALKQAIPPSIEAGFSSIAEPSSLSLNAAILGHGFLQKPIAPKKRTAEWVDEVMRHGSTAQETSHDSRMQAVPTCTGQSISVKGSVFTDAKSTVAKSRANLSQLVGPPSAIRTPLGDRELMWDNVLVGDMKAPVAAVGARLRRSSNPRSPDDITCHPSMISNEVEEKLG